MNEWHIQSRSHACQSCGQEFHSGTSYHTLLFDEKRELLRMDICVDCWGRQFAEARDRKGFLSHWTGEYEAPPAAPPEAIRKDTAETLLRKLVELSDPAYLGASYILAVMLERKRLLRVKEQLRVDGRRTFIYEQPKTGDIFTIPDPDLQLDQLEEVQRLVSSLLEHGLAGPPGPEASAPASPEAGPVPAEASAPVDPPPVSESAGSPESPLPPEVEPAAAAADR